MIAAFALALVGAALLGISSYAAAH